MSIDSQDAQAEIDQLRSRVARLEAELAEVEAWANRAVADAQAKTYWLDRWHLDLNAVMRRRSAERARGAVRAGRSLYRSYVRLRGRLRS